MLFLFNYTNPEFLVGKTKGNTSKMEIFSDNLQSKVKSSTFTAKFAAGRINAYLLA